MAKTKKKPARIKKKQTRSAKNENRIVRAITEFRKVLSNPELAKIINSFLGHGVSSAPTPKNDLPSDVLGPMIPQALVIPPPVEMAHEVPAANPPIIVEDRVADAPAQIPPPVDGFRGDKFEISKLLDMKGPIACEVMEPNIAETKVGKWGKIAKANMPGLIILTGVNKSTLGDDAKNITYAIYNSFKTSSRDVLSGFVVKKLTGVQGKKMIKLFKEHQAKNFEADLVHGGVQVGSDPEIFVENKDGVVVPAFEFLGSKTDTTVLSEGGQGGKKVYWDGYQAEFETRNNTCLAYHVDSIQAGLKAVLKAAKKKDKNARLSTKTVMDIPYDMLQKTPDVFKALGCMPSFNVYGLEGKEVNPNELIFRPSGGHLHFGCGSKPEHQIVEGVKALDAILGVACVSMFRNFDNPIRRELYGQAGQYRLPKWGIEYRTLSSAWLMHPILAHMVFELGRKALMFGFNGYRQLWNATDAETIEVIQKCDVEGARSLMKRNEDVFKRILSSSALKDTFDGKRTSEIAFNAFMNGCESIIVKPEDISGNWCLEGVWQGHSENGNASWYKVVPKLAKGGKV